MNHPDGIFPLWGDKRGAIISLIQSDIEWAAPERNRITMERAILAAPPSDLYVLPEMWSTGFAVQPDGIAEAEPSESLAWMHTMAQRLDAAIAGSIAVKLSDGTLRNRFYFVTPGGGETHYDKRHLFTYGGEHQRYTAGHERVVTQWRGVRFLLQVCYDLRFPVFSRNHGDYDCIIYVASWPESRQEVWNTLLRARAIENQCYVAGVNRIGHDPQCQYIGGTMLVDARGRIVEECRPGTPQTITAQLDMESLARFRTKFPVLHDADNYHLL